jgi:hypothetical protein
MTGHFRKTIAMLDGDAVEMLSLDGPHGNLAMKASDHPVVMDRAAAAALINALAQAFAFPVHLGCDEGRAAAALPAEIAELRGAAKEGSLYAL